MQRAPTLTDERKMTEMSLLYLHINNRDDIHPVPYHGIHDLCNHRDNRVHPEIRRVHPYLYHQSHAVGCTQQRLLVWGSPSAYGQEILIHPACKRFELLHRSFRVQQESALG
mmetsp:Transcript_37708/g.91607  ORF Transcript_37708/g.91607 Transcript_37708/m.91607 type:complete len:112 (+) Transcript_37708:80-415(+)